MLHAVSLVRMSLLWPSLPPPMCIRLCVSPYPWDTTSPLSPLRSPSLNPPLARDLSPSCAAQVQYAALDAHILIALYQALNTRGE